MNNAIQDSDDRALHGKVLQTTIRVGLVVLLAFWSFKVFQPFIIPFMWGMIIAAAIHPPFFKLTEILGGRQSLAGILVVLLGLVLLIVPIILLSGTLVDGITILSDGFQDGSLAVPPPPESISTWPVVGSQLHTIWSLASENLDAALTQIEPYLVKFGTWALSTGAGAGLGILHFMIAIIIAGVLLANATRSYSTVRRIAIRIAGTRGEELAELSVATIRSVAQGVLGIAFIQSLLGGIGFLLAGVPAAGFWAVLVLLVAVVQLPTLVVMGPIMVYVFATSDTLPAVVFSIWCVVVGVGDTFLKPLFLGRGVKIPMPVILLGALGGMLWAGIIGLFVGAVVLALSYKLFLAWLDDEPMLVLEESGEEQPPPPLPTL